MKNWQLGWILGAAGLGVALALRERARERRAFQFAGKVALITGGSRGLGLEIARVLARAGAKIAICARDTEELELAKKDLQDRGAEVCALACDLVQPMEIEEMVHSVQDRLGPIDVLINSAGTIQVGPYETMTDQDFQDSLQVHFWAPLHTIRAVLPGMQTRRRGRIVNIASIGGKIAVPHLLPYSAGKFALVGLSEGLRSEMRKHHIYVTTVCPGLIRTGSHIHARFKGQHKKEFTLFSLLDSSPITSVDSESAAQAIVRACRFGDSELIFPASAHAAVLIRNLMPGLTSDALSLINRLLPGPGGIGAESASGSDSRTLLSPSWLTGLSDEAALRNNQAVAD